MKIKQLVVHCGKVLLVVAPLVVLGVVLTPVALLFTGRNSKRLPKWARWFDNHDPNGDALDGYYKWKNYWDGSKPWRPKYNSLIPRYLWLAWRNPINFFSYYYLGFTIVEGDLVGASFQRWFQWPKSQLLRVSPDPMWDKIGNQDRSGVRYTELSNGKWEYYRVYVYPFYSTRCLRIRLGWKIGEFDDVLPGEHVQFVATVNPFSSFRGLKPLR